MRGVTGRARDTGLKNAHVAFRTHTRAHSRAHTHTCVHTHAHGHMHAHTLIHARIHMHTRAHTRAHARTCTHGHTCTHMGTHVCTQGTHAHTNMHTRTHSTRGQNTPGSWTLEPLGSGRSAVQEPGADAELRRPVKTRRSAHPPPGPGTRRPPRECRLWSVCELPGLPGVLPGTKHPASPTVPGSQ